MRDLPGAFLACAVALGVALAGCSGGDPSADQSLEEGFTDLGLEATATTGVIRGLVVDPTILPVAGATVTLIASGATTTTGEDGLFGFDDLEAGPYFLAIEKPGFAKVQASAEVLVGVASPPIVRILLQPDPSSLPYVVAQSYSGYVQCSFKVANYVFDAGSCDPQGTTGLSANDDSQPWFAVTGPPLFYQSEMMWESTQTLGTQMVTIQFACDEGDCGETDTNRLCNVRGPSPLVCRVNQTASLVEGGGGHGIEEAELGTALSGYSVQMFANCFECVPTTVLGVGVVLEQRFDVFNHLFYGYEPPADWMFVTDGPPPPPPA